MSKNEILKIYYQIIGAKFFLLTDKKYNTKSKWFDVIRFKL